LKKSWVGSLPLTATRKLFDSCISLANRFNFMFTDSHCHLNFPELMADLPAIRQAMVQAGVGRALCISTTLEEFPVVHQLALDFDNFWATAGVHPDNEGVQEPDVAELVRLGSLPRVVGVGETGLDYYRLNGRSVADMHWQRERFRVHIRAAQQLRKPLVIHTRQASQDTLEILREEGEDGGGSSAGGVFHCFTEDQATARQALDLGFYISFSGILTFKSAQSLRDVAAMVPLDRLLIETDSPYLAPMPYRGKTNNPSYVALVAAQVAQIKQLPLEDMARLTSENFERLFRGVMQ
jgi:TatD DNase family protein